MAILSLSQFETTSFNGTSLTKVTFNGTTVWEPSGVDTSAITVSISSPTTGSSNNFGIKFKTDFSSVVTIDWGDGTESVASSFGNSIAHLYTVIKPYVIKISSTNPVNIDYFGISSGETLSATKVTSVILGDNASSIPMFNNDLARKYTSLNYVYVGKNITTIPSLTFNKVSSVTAIDIDKDSSLNKIEGQAFYGCTGLLKLWFPSSLTNVETLYNFRSMTAFYNCSPTLKIYLAGVVQAEFYQYWNAYSSSGLLAYETNISYEVYKNL